MGPFKGNKPLQLRTIFILNLLKILLAFSIYTIITVKGLTPGKDPTWILYTAFGYVFTFSLKGLFAYFRESCS